MATFIHGRVFLKTAVFPSFVCNYNPVYTDDRNSRGEGCHEHFQQTGGQSETPNKPETDVSQRKNTVFFPNSPLCPEFLEIIFF